MSWRVHRITQEVRKHDRCLFAKKSHTGMIQIFRNNNGSPKYILSLTDNWSANGSPVEWGLEPIRQRLIAIDLSYNQELMTDILKQYEETEKSKMRNFRNNTESFLIDFRSQFKKTFNDINTSSLAKTDRRRKDDRRISNGNY